MGEGERGREQERKREQQKTLNNSHCNPKTIHWTWVGTRVQISKEQYHNYICISNTGTNYIINEQYCELCLRGFSQAQIRWTVTNCRNEYQKRCSNHFSNYVFPPDERSQKPLTAPVLWQSYQVSVSSTCGDGSSSGLCPCSPSCPRLLPIQPPSLCLSLGVFSSLLPTVLLCQSKLQRFKL